jgi:large-conductance mechanosensitive channel
MLVKIVNVLHHKEEKKIVPPAPTESEKLLMEIRDLLKK